MNSSETLRGIDMPRTKIKTDAIPQGAEFKTFCEHNETKSCEKKRRDNVRLLHKLMRLTKVIDVALN